MRILHVSQPTDAGVAMHVRNVARDGVRRRWDIAVACPDSGGLSTEVSAVGALHIRWAATRSPGPRTVAEALSLRRIIAGYEPEIVHLHSSKAGLAGRLMGPKGGRPHLIFQPHAWSFEALSGPLRSAARYWERLAAQKAARIICVSEAEAARGRQAGIESPLTVIHNGVDLLRFQPATSAERATTKKALGLTDGPLAVCIGRLSKQKGQDLLLRAWSGDLGATLALVGDGPLRAELEDSAEAGVFFVGATSDVRPWLRAADLFVMPSRWEGLSLALLEALASGLPIVTFDVPGAHEAVGDDAGVVVPRGNGERLVGEVERRVRDADLRAAESRAARKRAEEMFDLRDCLERTAALYSSLATST